jgi:hypothetical protein
LVGGLPRPVLLWPAGLEDRLPAEGVRAVLAHELAHLRRRDHWVRWLELAAGCVMWWNPLFALVRRKIRQYAEQACDAWVVNLLPKARRAYAEALLTVCETVSRVAEPAPALGVGGDDRRDFQRRLTMILRDPVACRPTRRTLLAVGLLALLAVPGWSLGQKPAETPADPAKKHDIEVVVRDVADGTAGEFLLDLLVEAEDAKAQPAGNARDKKLQELEEKIQALLKEIQALKAEKQPGTVRSRATEVRERKVAEGQKEAEVARAEAIARAKAIEAQARAQVDAARAQAEVARAQAEQARRELERALDWLKKKGDESAKPPVKDKQDADLSKMQLELERKLADLHKKAEDTAKSKALDALKSARAKEEQKVRTLPAGRSSMTRQTYTLPAEKAKALAEFVRENLKPTVVDTTLDGDTLTVTTTPEAQKAIGQLVELLRGQPGNVNFRFRLKTTEKEMEEKETERKKEQDDDQSR